MVQTCCITSCKSRKTPGDKLSFYLPPRNEEIKKKWAEVIGRELTRHMKVCAKHFSPDCYQQRQWRSYKYLKDDAVPTLAACYWQSPSESLEDLSVISTSCKTNFIEMYLKPQQSINLPCEQELAKQSTPPLPTRNLPEVTLTNHLNTSNGSLPGVILSTSDTLRNIPIEIKTEIDQTSESSFQESPFEFVSTDNLEKTDVLMQIALLEAKLKQKELAEKGLLDNQLEYKKKVISIFQNKNRTIKSLREKNKRLEEKVTRITKLLEVEKRERAHLELRVKKMRNTNEDGSKKKRRFYGWRKLEAALKEDMSEVESEVDELELELEKLYK